MQRRELQQMRAQISASTIRIEELEAAVQQHQADLTAARTRHDEAAGEWKAERLQLEQTILDERRAAAQKLDEAVKKAAMPASAPHERSDMAAAAGARLDSQRSNGMLSASDRDPTSPTLAAALAAATGGGGNMFEPQRALARLKDDEIASLQSQL